MSIEYFHLKARDGVTLSVSAFPARREGPVVIIVHGIASHMGWYAPLAEALRERDLSVYIPDRRGSGVSEGPRGHMKSEKDLVTDLIDVISVARERHGVTQVHLIGISLGAVISILAVERDPRAIASLTLLAPGLASRVKVSLFRRLRVLRRSWTEPTRLYDLPFGVNELADSAVWRQALAKDPLRCAKVSSKFLVEMFKMQGRARRSLRRIAIRSLVILAGRDAVIDNDRLFKILRRAPKDMIWIELWEGAPHVLPSSRPRSELVAKLCEWIHATAEEPRRSREVVLPPFSGPESELPLPPDLDRETS